MITLAIHDSSTNGTEYLEFNTLAEAQAAAQAHADTDLPGRQDYEISDETAVLTSSSDGPGKLVWEGEN